MNAIERVFFNEKYCKIGVNFISTQWEGIFKHGYLLQRNFSQREQMVKEMGFIVIAKNVIMK